MSELRAGLRPGLRQLEKQTYYQVLPWLWPPCAKRLRLYAHSMRGLRYELVLEVWLQVSLVQMFEDPSSRRHYHTCGGLLRALGGLDWTDEGSAGVGPFSNDPFFDLRPCADYGGVLYPFAERHFWRGAV